MIVARPMVVQLRLDLAESPAPAAVLWELVGEAERQELYDSQAAHLLVGHVGEAAEIAPAYVYLMENSYATGTVTVADGGYMLV